MNYPTHIAFIPDGNRRWAKKHGKNLWEVYDGGINKLYEISRWVEPIKEIKYLTFWGFSSENFERNKEEIEELWKLFGIKLDELLNRELKGKGIRLRFLGEIEKFPQNIQDKLNSAMKATESESERNLTVLLAYGGRSEILKAVKRIAREAKEGKIDESAINETLFSNYLYTFGIPDPDLIIRTANERRLSGLFPWQSVYSEFYFVKKDWPELSKKDFEKALRDYSKRKRKFGK